MFIGHFQKLDVVTCDILSEPVRNFGSRVFYLLELCLVVRKSLKEKDFWRFSTLVDHNFVYGKK